MVMKHAVARISLTLLDDIFAFYHSYFQTFECFIRKSVHGLLHE
jgi:hypothetical protein